MRPLRPCLLLVAALAATIPVLLADGGLHSPGAEDGARQVHIVPGGAGKRNGRDWDNAGSLDDLSALALPGSRVWIRADRGAYTVNRPIELHRGGTSTRPTTVEGVDGTGNPQRAVLLGGRTTPYKPGGEPGIELFRINRGADHLSFRNLSFRGLGHCFRIAGDVANLAIADSDATNVRRFVENLHTGTSGSATVAGLTIRNVQVRGFSKDAIRVQYDTHDVLIEDVLGDSERQDGDNFAEGVTIAGTAHDVVLRRVTMRNAHDTTNPFWNGDGFATEKDAYRIRFEDTVATGSTDAGYDLKSRDTILLRAAASDNATNFKLWGRGITLQHCVGLAPFKRGGTGEQNQIQVNAEGDVTVKDCRLIDSDPATVIVKVSGPSMLTLTGTTIVRHPQSQLSEVDPAGSLSIRP